MIRQQPVFICRYRDGTVRTGTYAETLQWFNEALKTDNPCTVSMPDTPYTRP